MVKVWPPIVAVPVRAVVVVLAADVTVTLPVPLRLLPLAMVIHDADEDALHAQPVAVVNVTLFDWPATAAVTAAGERE